MISLQWTHGKINDPSDQQDGMSSCDAAGMRNHVSPQHKVLHPDAVWITQNVVTDFLLQHGYGELFAAEPNGLTSNADKKETYNTALATSLDADLPTVQTSSKLRFHRGSMDPILRLRIPVLTVSRVNGSDFTHLGTGFHRKLFNCFLKTVRTGTQMCKI
jgi:hypothetical protein